jgi:hypothetical protein
VMGLTPSRDHLIEHAASVDQVRRVRFEGPTRKKINPVSGALGDQSHFELVWERVG